MSPPHTSRGSVRLFMALSTAAVIALSGTSVWLFNGSGSNGSAPDETPRAKVLRGTLRLTLRQTGTFEAEKALPVRAEIRGSSKIVWLIDEGTTVKKGQVVVELDKTDVENDIVQLSSQVEKAQANLVAAQADEEITKLEGLSRIRQAQITQEMSGLEIKKFNEGTKPKEIRDAKIKIDQAVVKLSRLDAIDARMPDMFKQGFVTKEEVQQSSLDVQTAKNELETARLESEILTGYTHPMQVKKLNSDVQQAESELERFRQMARRREAQTRATATQCDQEFSRTSKLLKDAREQLTNMTVHAAGDGIVVYGSGARDRWNNEEIKLGTLVHRMLTLMRLPNLNTMQAIIQVHEADVNRIRVDEKSPQPAAITTESLPGRTFDGSVKKVETIAQSNWFNRNVKWFTTTISLKSQIPGIRPGMTAAVEILIDELHDVLYVPIQSVHTRQGRSYCYVPAGGSARPEKRPVVVGSSNNSFAEIKEGLKEGEQVLLVKPEFETSDEEQSPNRPAKRPRNEAG